MNCYDAFKNLNVVASLSGIEISPCCNSPTQLVQTVDFYNSDYLQKVRDSWTSGQWPTECFSCREAEDRQILSRRQGSNDWYTVHGLDNTNVELIRMDYNVGDLCNLACAICSPKFSSVWKKELGINVNNRKTVFNKVWKDLDLTNLKYIHFNGGEPLLSKEHVIFLHSVPNKHEVHINYNTNGTILPSDELLELWSRFKLVQIDFSIDDIGSRFEYQRYPAIWQSVKDNLQWYIDHCSHNTMFAVNITVSRLNVSNIEKLNNWLQNNFGITRFGDQIQHRQQIAQGVFSLKSKLDIVRKQLEQLDNRRGTNWKLVFPELIDTN